MPGRHCTCGRSRERAVVPQPGARGGQVLPALLRSRRRHFPRRLACPACGYQAYYNPKPVACAIPREPDGRVWLLRRAFEPGKGLWTFPGGFVDLGETVEDGARRETREELDVAIEVGPLVGVYSRTDDRVVLIVFEAAIKGTPQTTEEATEVEAFAPADIPWGELAFWSTEQALRDLLGGGPRRPSRSTACR